jgi:hypothetical protein
MSRQLNRNFDSTMDHITRGRSTTTRIFPVYAPRQIRFASTTSSTFNNIVDISHNSEFMTHNIEVITKPYNKKMDRYVNYNESMLKIKGMKSNRR